MADASECHDRWGGAGNSHLVLTNLQTAEHYVPRDIHSLGGWSSVFDGQSGFELGELSDLAAGNYSLELEYSHDGKILSRGYKATVAIRDTPQGKELAVEHAAKK